MISDQVHNAQISYEAHMKFVQSTSNPAQTSHAGVKLQRLAVKPEHQSLGNSSSKRSKNFFMMDHSSNGGGAPKEKLKLTHYHHIENPKLNYEDVGEADRNSLIQKMRKSEL